MFKYHILALLIGTVLEFTFGRIYSLWNPFDSIKKWIEYLDRALLGHDFILLEPAKQKNLGLWLVVLTIAPVFIISAFFSMLCYEIWPILGLVFEALLSYLCIDANYVWQSAEEIVADYYSDGIDAYRNSAIILTNKDMSSDNCQEITSKVVTSIANVASDSVIIPIFIMFLFGPVGGFIFRTVDMLDEKVGYTDSRYYYFGYYAARLSSLFTKLFGRASGALNVFAAKYTFGDFNWRNARYIHLRDRNKAISAYAGALSISLKEGQIGDEDNKPSPMDIKRASHLLKNTYILLQLILLIIWLF